MNVFNPTAADYRQPPHNLEVEQELIGAVLVNNDAFAAAESVVQAKHFYLPAHGKIWERIAALIDRGEIANPVTVKGFVQDDEAYRAHGGIGAYLAQLAANVSSIVSVADYARLIRDLALRRDLIRIGEEMVNQAYDAGLDASPMDQIEQAESSLFGLAEKGDANVGFQPFGTSLRNAVDMAAAALRRGGLSGITTGLADMDKKLGGLQKSDLIILAGRPAMGKTALATTMAFNAALRSRESAGQEGAGIAFFSLEMSPEQLATRILSERVRVSSEKLRKGEISDREFIELTRAAEEIEAAPFFIDATGAISIAALATRARRLKRQHPEIGLVVVDYLQLVTQPNQRKGDGRVQEVSEVSRGLKALAKELNVPVLALSQLSRQVEQRDDKRPQLSDLRESGAIEQDADIVMFVYRESYYLSQRQPNDGDAAAVAAWQADMDRHHNKAEVIIGKNRHGPTGTIELFFEPEFTRFADLAREDRYGLPA